MGKKGKGKQPQGRAKARGKAQKSSPRSGGGWAADLVRGQGQFDDDDGDPRKMFKGFSQGSPRGDNSPRNINVKLRHQAIAFVSAGTNSPAEPQREITVAEEDLDVTFDGDDSESSEDEEEDDIGEEDIDDSTLQTNIVMNIEMEAPESAIGRMNITSPKETEALPFFVDTTGDPALAAGASTNGKRPVARSPSPARSDTSEEVVFHGRSNGPIRTIVDNIKPARSGRPVSRATPSPRPPATKAASPAQPAESSSTPHITDGLLAALTGSPEPSSSSIPLKGWLGQPSKFDKEAAAAASEPWQPAPSTPYWRKGKPRPDLDPQPDEPEVLKNTPTRQSKVSFEAPKQDLNAEESIEALQADWKQVLREKKLAKNESLEGAEDMELDLNIKLGANRRRKRGRKKSNRQLRNAIASDEEDDEEAAYDDYMQNLKAQLDAEEGDGEMPAFTPININAVPISGPSMVVDGAEIADDELLKHAAEQESESEWEDEDSDNPDELIGQDASQIDDEEAMNLSELDSSDLEDELEYNEREQWEDEEDLRERRQAAYSDEHLARLFAKQQELGIDSNELFIDDGMMDDDLEGIGDLVAARNGLRDLTNLPIGPSKKRAKRGRKGDFTFPDASALADTVEQYGEHGFDILDMDRPSLRNTKKGRKGKLPPELEALSDDELRDEMLGTWENDRVKKRLKKAEREELRQQGLLGSAAKKGKADLSQKYLQGMNMKQIHEELRIFLEDDGQNSRAFPPMDKRDRKTLHEVANALNLKSKSVGTGHNRAPVLYKTSFTSSYSEHTMNKIIYSASKGFLKNSAMKGKKGKKAAGSGFNAKGPRGGMGGFDKAAVSLRNGEIVGANAAELGKENLGHKLMEKMGWTAGQALGKEGEGLKMPVQQVMRTGRAGLG